MSRDERRGQQVSENSDPPRVSARIPGPPPSGREPTSCDYYNQNGCTLDADHRGECR